MKIKFTSITVEDQEKALRFYTEVLGFTKMADIPLGDYRWLTVTSPDGIEGVELVLEPLAFSPSRDYQRALFEARIPASALITDDIDKDVSRLRALDVVFRGEPLDRGVILSVMFEDTCGNLINLVQPKM